MYKKQFSNLTFALGLAGLLLASCTSKIQKADIANTANPQEEVAKLGSDIQSAITNNIDVLAPDYFKTSVKSLEEAKRDLANGQKQEEILNDIRTGRGALEKAYSESENHEALAPSLFAARQAALKAGAMNYPELDKDLRNLDSDTAKQARDLSKASTEKLSQLQDRYIALEKQAVILRELSQARGIVSGAKKDGAEKRAPLTLKKAELNLKSAESSIATNLRNPAGYHSSVVKANGDATLLLEVMAVSNQNGKILPETTALELVNQNRQIKSLKSNLSSTTADRAAAEMANTQISEDLKTKEQALEEKTAALATTGQNLETTNKELAMKVGELKAKDSTLESAISKVEIQRAIEEARNKFSSDEAETYQQGDILLIRLKKMGFASGHSDLPAASLATLAKVAEVAKSLNAKEIKVEGHTDSSGTDKQNKVISEARAGVVAQYFKSSGFNSTDIESEGYGYEKPIATNKSKEGRAKNRRVDVIITPNNAESEIQ